MMVLLVLSRVKRAIPHSSFDKVHKLIGLEEETRRHRSIINYYRNSHATLAILFASTQLLTRELILSNKFITTILQLRI